MPSIYDNNLIITSKFGFKRSGGAISSVVPAIAETTKYLWERDERPASEIDYATKVLRHQPVPVPTFESPPGSTATISYLSVLDNSEVQETLRWYTTASTQTITLINEGNSPLTVTTITQNPPSAFSPIAVIHTPTPFTISSSSSYPLTVGYYSHLKGTFSGFLVALSDFVGGAYKINTIQEIQDTFELEVSPTSRTTIADQFGQRVLHSYTIIPVVNRVERPDLNIEFDASFSNPTNFGWAIQNAANNTFTVRFSVLTVNNDTGTYTAPVVVTSQGGVGITATVVVNNTVQVGIDRSKFANYGSWVSAAAPYNSVIGISYDKIDDERYLTIGVGTGGDNTPIYAFGGQVFTATSTIGVLAESTDIDYAGWSTVYRIPLGMTAQRFLSGARDSDGNFLYKIKSTEGIEYEQYFGSEGSKYSMFIVDHDGLGNINISMTHLRELSEDESLNRTLRNLTRAFYYYSDVDEPGRYYQLASGPILDQTVTELFIGFDSIGNRQTSIVPLPNSF